MCFTALPLIVKAIFEKDIEVPPRVRRNLVGGESRPVINDPDAIARAKFPQCYYLGKDNIIFTPRNFIFCMANGFLHSIAVFFIPLYSSIESYSINNDGHNFDMWGFSITSFSCIILIVNIKLALHTRYWNIYHILAILFTSVFPYFGYIFVYDVIAATPAF